MLLRQLRRVPSPTQRPHQPNARCILTVLNIDFGHLILQECLFGCQYLKIAGNAAFVACLKR